MTPAATCTTAGATTCWSSAACWSARRRSRRSCARTSACPTARSSGCRMPIAWRGPRRSWSPTAPRGSRRCCASSYGGASAEPRRRARSTSSPACRAVRTASCGVPRCATWPAADRLPAAAELLGQPVRALAQHLLAEVLHAPVLVLGLPVLHEALPQMPGGRVHERDVAAVRDLQRRRQLARVRVAGHRPLGAAVEGGDQEVAHVDAAHLVGERLAGVAQLDQVAHARARPLPAGQRGGTVEPVAPRVAEHLEQLVAGRHRPLALLVEHLGERLVVVVGVV